MQYARQESNLRHSASKATGSGKNAEENVWRDGAMTAVTVAHQAARDLLRAVADGDPRVVRKATDLAAAILAIGAPAVETKKKVRK